MPLDKLTDDMKKRMIVDERYTFFQIETKLRQIIGEACEPLRSRITRESEITRKTQSLADDAKREVARQEPRIDQALGLNTNITKCFHALTTLDQEVKQEKERTENYFDTVNSNMNNLELKM